MLLRDHYHDDNVSVCCLEMAAVESKLSDLSETLEQLQLPATPATPATPIDVG